METPEWFVPAALYLPPPLVRVLALFLARGRRANDTRGQPQLLLAISWEDLAAETGTARATLHRVLRFSLSQKILTLACPAHGRTPAIYWLPLLHPTDPQHWLSLSKLAVSPVRPLRHRSVKAPAQKRRGLTGGVSTVIPLGGGVGKKEEEISSKRSSLPLPPPPLGVVKGAVEVSPETPLRRDLELLGVASPAELLERHDPLRVRAALDYVLSLPIDQVRSPAGLLVKLLQHPQSIPPPLHPAFSRHKPVVGDLLDQELPSKLNWQGRFQKWLMALPEAEGEAPLAELKARFNREIEQGSPAVPAAAARSPPRGRMLS